MPGWDCSHEHIAADVFARSTAIFIGTRHESAMSCKEMLASKSNRFASTPSAKKKRGEGGGTLVQTSPVSQHSRLTFSVCTRC